MALNIFEDFYHPLNFDFLGYNSQWAPETELEKYPSCPGAFFPQDRSPEPG